MKRLYQRLVSQIQNIDWVDRIFQVLRPLPGCSPCINKNLFIEREQELALLKKIFQRSHEGGGQICLIRGSEGSGRTILVRKFLDTYILPQYKEKVAVGYGESSTTTPGNIFFEPILRVFQSLMVEEGTKSSLELSRLVLEGLRNTPFVRFLASTLPKTSGIHKKLALPLDEEELAYQVHESAAHLPTVFYYLFSTFERIARKNTLLVILKHAHLYDRATQKFLSFLAARLSDLPILLLFICGPEKETPDYLIKLGECSKIDLLPFSQAVTHNYLNRVFHKNEFEPDLIRYFIAATKGLPLSCFETCKFWVQKRVVVYKNSRWCLNDKMEDYTLPDSLEDVVFENLDSAHTAGHENIIAKLLNEFSEQEALIDFPCKQNITSLHPLYNQVLYKKLTPEQRQRFHRELAYKFEKELQEQIRYKAPLLVFHFTKGAIHSKVAYYSVISAMEELYKGGGEESVFYCKKGLDSLNQLPELNETDIETQLQLLILLGVSYIYLQEFQKSEKQLNKALKIMQETEIFEREAEIFCQFVKLAPYLGLKLEKIFNIEDLWNDRRMPEAGAWPILLLQELGKFFLQKGQYKKAEKALVQAKNLVGQRDSSSLRGPILNELGKLKEKELKWREALQFYQESFKYAQKYRLVEEKAQSLINLGNLYNNQESWEEALVKYKEALQLYKKKGHIDREAFTQRKIGAVLCKQGRWAESIQFLENSYALFEKIENPIGQAIAANLQIVPLNQQGKPALASEKFELALNLNAIVGRLEGKAFCLQNMARMLMKSDEYIQAQEHLQQALGIWSQLADSDCKQGSVIHDIGRCLLKRNKTEEALPKLEQGLQLKITSGDQSGQAAVLKTIGLLYNYQGKWKEADKVLQRSIRISKNAGIVGLSAVTYTILGDSALQQSALEKAEQYYQNSYNVNLEVGNREGEAISLERMGKLALKQNQTAKAEHQFLQALEIYKKMGDRPGCAGSYDQLGKLNKHIQNHNKAQEFFDKALQQKQKIQNSLGIAYTLYECALNHYEQKKFKSALEHLQETLEIQKRYEDLYGLGKTYHIIGKVLLSQGKNLEAMENFSKSWEIREKIQDLRGLAFTCMEIGQVYIQLNRIDKALENLKKSLQNWQKLAHKKYSAQINYHMGELYQREAKQEEARKCFEKAYAYYKDVDHFFLERIKIKLEELEE